MNVAKDRSRDIETTPVVASQERLQNPTTSHGSQVLIIEGNSFTSLALMTQFDYFEIKCDVSHYKVNALDKIESRIQSGEPFYDLILIDQYSLHNKGIELAETICQKLSPPPYICIMSETDVQQKRVIDESDRAVVKSCMLKPIFEAEILELLMKAGLMPWKNIQSQFK